MDDIRQEQGGHPLRQRSPELINEISKIEANGREGANQRCRSTSTVSAACNIDPTFRYAEDEVSDSDALRNDKPSSNPRSVLWAG
jgi:hypothetical protein